MENLGFIITGRMKSTRLRMKLALEINEREVIAHMIDRAKLYFAPENIVIATSNNPQDDILQEISEREGIKCFRGSEDDVVLRLYEAARINSFDYFVNITADCPLFGYDFIDALKELALNENADLVTSLDLPHGIFTYLIKTDAFERVIEMKKTANTEVWGDYFYNNPNVFKTIKYKVKPDEERPDYRITLDYPEDYEFFKKIYEYFGKETYKISSKKLVDFLDENPGIVNINKDCKKLYQKRWEEQRVTNIEKEAND
jgi:spore coat polysaccharide biosynthesis protein SpsF